MVFNRHFVIFTAISIFLGEMINEKDKCKKCHGKKTVKEDKILEVNIHEETLNNNVVLYLHELTSTSIVCLRRVFSNEPCIG